MSGRGRQITESEPAGLFGVVEHIIDAVVSVARDSDPPIDARETLIELSARALMLAFIEGDHHGVDMAETLDDVWQRWRAMADELRKPHDHSH